MSTEQSFALGIDLGGSKIYAVVTDSTGKVLSDVKVPTDAASGPEMVAHVIMQTGLEALKKLNIGIKDVHHIGVAVPSPVDPVTGDCHHAPNLGWKNFSMKNRFNSLFGQEVYIGNDGNLGILGEYRCGAAKGFKNVVGYFVGTGLGGGIIIDGKLLVGNSGLGAELGHNIVKHGGRRCGCGHRGCIEAYCSKVAFVKALKKEICKRGAKTSLPPEKFGPESENIKSKHLAKAYIGEDATVRKVVNKGMLMLGVSAASVCATIAPECIVLGGGVMAAMGQEVMPVFRASFENHLFGIAPSKIAIRLSSLGDSAVAVGAAILAREKGRV